MPKPNGIDTTLNEIQRRLNAIVPKPPKIDVPRPDLVRIELVRRINGIDHYMSRETMQQVLTAVQEARIYRVDIDGYDDSSACPDLYDFVYSFTKIKKGRPAVHVYTRGAFKSKLAANVSHLIKKCKARRVIVGGELSRKELREFKEVLDFLEIDWVDEEADEQEFQQAFWSRNDLQYVLIKQNVNYGLTNPIRCRRVFTEIAISFAGEVELCSGRKGRSVACGHVTEGLFKIWDGEVLNHYRALHWAERRAEIEPCARCTLGSHETLMNAWSKGRIRYPENGEQAVAAARERALKLISDPSLAVSDNSNVIFQS